MYVGSLEIVLTVLLTPNLIENILKGNRKPIKDCIRFNRSELGCIYEIADFKGFNRINISLSHFMILEGGGFSPPPVNFPLELR